MLNGLKHHDTGFYPRDAGCFNIARSISVTHHISRMKDKNYTIISINAEKLLAKFNIFS
jgi:hypothetical protein